MGSDEDFENWKAESGTRTYSMGWGSHFNNVVKAVLLEEGAWSRDGGGAEGELHLEWLSKERRQQVRSAEMGMWGGGGDLKSRWPGGTWRV